MPPSGYVPDNGVIIAIGADSIIVGWPAVTPDDGREFLQRYRIDFTIESRSTTEGRRKRQSASHLFAGPDATSVNLDPEPYSEYTIMVTAEFEADGTPFSALITAPTIIQSNEEGQSGNTFLSFSLLNLMPSLPPSLAPSEPRNLIASNESYRSVNLRWELPAITNGIISLYRVGH